MVASSGGTAMVNRLLLWAAGNPRLERVVADSRIAGKMVHRFVAGNRLEDAVEVTHQLNQRRIGGILDLLGEGVKDLAGAAEATAQYRESVAIIPARGLDATISVKPSQLGLTIDRDTCLANLGQILKQAREAGVTVEIDMEQSELVTDTIEVFRRCVAEYPQVRLAMQVCLRRTAWDLEALAPLKPRVRLVKGAYSEPLDISLRSKAEITAQYKFLTDWLFEHGSDPAFGTHDDACIEYAMATATRTGVGQAGFEVQMLYGIRRDLQEKLANEGFRVRVYIPFGSAWYPYLMRRMAENPSNLRFFVRALVGH
jgi:proline dehydrogenase